VASNKRVLCRFHFAQTDRFPLVFSRIAASMPRSRLAGKDPVPSKSLWKRLETVECRKKMQTLPQGETFTLDQGDWTV
jgi:hypothetical protein